MSRRSVNYFDKDKDLDMRLVKRVIAESFQAPSAYNLQPWRIILVKSDEAKEKLYDLAFKQPKVLEAPITLIIVGDKDGYEKDNKVWSEYREALGNEKTDAIIKGARNLYGKSEYTKLKFAESHGGLLAMNLMYLFKANEIDTHPMSGMYFDKVKESFNLKDSEEVVMLLAIGYKDESMKLSVKRERKTYEEVVIEL